MTKKLRSLYNWFDIQRDYIIKGHENEWVLITPYEVLGYFPTQKSAADSAEQKGLKVGNFLAQMCITSEQEVNGFYNSNMQMVIEDE